MKFKCEEKYLHHTAISWWWCEELWLAS